MFGKISAKFFLFSPKENIELEVMENIHISRVIIFFLTGRNTKAFRILK